MAELNIRERQAGDVTVLDMDGRITIGEGSVAQIAQRYPSLFTPAGYAFAIWGLIYLTTLLYALYRLASPRVRSRARAGRRRQGAW